MNTLLLTGTIKPSQKIIWKNLNQLNYKNRQKDYIRALVYYITQSDFENIVFCDNSNTDIDNDNLIKNLASLFWKNIELIKFQWNIYLSENYWYWCWEAEIFDYVFENSKIIKNSDSWYKISWRYLVKDINIILKKLENNNYFFQKPWLMSNPFSIATSFFKINNDIYNKYLYKKQINFYEKYKTRMAIEKYWYILLRDFLLKTKQKNNYNIKFKYPEFWNFYWFIWKWRIRTIIYYFYYLFNINQYWFIHKIIDFILYKKRIKNLIKKNFYDI